MVKGWISNGLLSVSIRDLVLNPIRPILYWQENYSAYSIYTCGRSFSQWEYQSITSSASLGLHSPRSSSGEVACLSLQTAVWGLLTPRLSVICCHLEGADREERGMENGDQTPESIKGVTKLDPMNPHNYRHCGTATVDYLLQQLYYFLQLWFVIAAMAFLPLRIYRGLASSTIGLSNYTNTLSSGDTQSDSFKNAHCASTSGEKRSDACARLWSWLWVILIMLCAAVCVETETRARNIGRSS